MYLRPMQTPISTAGDSTGQVTGTVDNLSDEVARRRHEIFCYLPNGLTGTIAPTNHTIAGFPQFSRNVLLAPTQGGSHIPGHRQVQILHPQHAPNTHPHLLTGLGITSRNSGQGLLPMPHSVPYHQNPSSLTYNNAAGVFPLSSIRTNQLPERPGKAIKSMNDANNLVNSGESKFLQYGNCTLYRKEENLGEL